MATSGSINLTATGTDIITEALEQLGVLSEGETPSTDQLTSCNRTLNYLVKGWQAEGLNLFSLQKSYLFLQKDINEYQLVGTSGGSHWTDSYNSTQLAVAAVATDTTITVDDASAISDADYIGVALDSGASHWTTVNGAPAGNVVTLTDAIPSAAAIDKYVYSYTTKADRPMKITNCLVRDTDSRDVEVPVITRDEYIRLPDKGSDGRVNQVYFEPHIGTSKLFVWPETNNVTDILVVWSQRTLDDIDTVATDEVDFPQEWFLPLAFNLANILIPKYGAPPSHGALVSQLAKFWKDKAEGWDSEDDFQITPDIDWNN